MFPRRMETVGCPLRPLTLRVVSSEWLAKAGGRTANPSTRRIAWRQTAGWQMVELSDLI
jgi:hypothetical protein